MHGVTSRNTLIYKVPNSIYSKKNNKPSKWILFMWMQNTPLHYEVNRFFWRFAVIFLPDSIYNCVYTANLENHCTFILVELQRNKNLRYFVTGIEFWVENGYRLPSFFFFF